MDRGVTPDAAARFRADLARLWPEVGEGGPFGVAVSGGPDSLALLLLAHAAMPGRVVAATVDHALRPASADEAAMVAQVCARLGVPHETAIVTVEAGNLQDRAREARYGALCASFGRRGVEVFATAHHADDQAETVLMRLARGSGLAGLAGIRARRVVAGEDPLGEYLLVRPLLGWRRSELLAIVEGAGIAPASDPSNHDARFDRVRMRERLAEMPWLDPSAVARSAALLQEAEDAVADAVSATIARAITWEDGVAWVRWGYARLIQVEVVSHVLHELGATVPRSAAAQMVDRLVADGHATLGGVMARRAMHRADARTEVDSWRFEREPPRRTG